MRFKPVWRSLHRMTQADFDSGRIVLGSIKLGEVVPRILPFFRGAGGALRGKECLLPGRRSSRGDQGAREIEIVARSSRMPALRKAECCYRIVDASRVQSAFGSCQGEIGHRQMDCEIEKQGEDAQAQGERGDAR